MYKISAKDIKFYASWFLGNNRALPKFRYQILHNLINITKLLGDNRNYIPPIPVPSSAKCIATQILVIAKVNRRKDFILRGFICDIIRLSKELPVQS